MFSLRMDHLIFDGGMCNFFVQDIFYLVQLCMNFFSSLEGIYFYATSALQDIFFGIFAPLLPIKYLMVCPLEHENIGEKSVGS